MKHILYIAIGGMLGALSRYFLSKFITQNVNDIFPWGTFVINVTGCFFIGLFYIAFDRIITGPDLRSFLTIGFLGAYTTFSTYSLETINLLREGEIRLGLLNIFLNNFVGLILVIGGIYTARIIFKILKIG